MADSERLQSSLNQNKTWLVKLWFSIPNWYVLSTVEEDKLLNYIVTERENSRIARCLDCTTICNEQYCYFCSEVRALSQKCNTSPRTQ